MERAVYCKRARQYKLAFRNQTVPGTRGISIRVARGSTDRERYDHHGAEREYQVVSGTRGISIRVARGFTERERYDHHGTERGDQKVPDTRIFIKRPARYCKAG